MNNGSMKKKHTGNKKQTEQKTIAAAFWTLAVVLCLYIGVILFGENGFLHLQQLRDEHQQIKDHNASIEENNNQLYLTVNRLKNDPAYIEHVIREQLQMNSPDEIIFKFDNGRGAKSQDR